MTHVRLDIEVVPPIYESAPSGEVYLEQTGWVCLTGQLGRMTPSGALTLAKVLTEAALSAALPGQEEFHRGFEELC